MLVGPAGTQKPATALHLSTHEILVSLCCESPPDFGRMCCVHNFQMNPTFSVWDFLLCLLQKLGRV